MEHHENTISLSVESVKLKAQSLFLDSENDERNTKGIVHLNVEKKQL